MLQDTERQAPAVQEPGHLLVRLNEAGIMRDADPENVAHHTLLLQAARAADPAS